MKNYIFLLVAPEDYLGLSGLRKNINFKASLTLNNKLMLIFANRH